MISILARRNRSGTPAFLRQAGGGAVFGFTVPIVERVPAGHTPGSQAASSTATRAAVLEAGDVALATRLLGHPFAIMGKVIQGQKLEAGPWDFRRPISGGTRAAGCATASMPSRWWLGTKTYDGVASYGRRPTFDNGPALIEAYLFDFSGDLYGETIEVDFHRFIRGEEKFASVEELKDAMKRDEAAARAILKTLR